MAIRDTERRTVIGTNPYSDTMISRLSIPGLKSPSLTKSFCGFLILACLSGTDITTAQEQTAQRITFDDAVLIALERNVTIKRGQNILRSQEITVQSERADFLPNLNFSSGMSRNYGSFQNPVTFAVDTRTTSSFNMGASSSINIFNGFADVASLQQAQKVLESQEYTFERTRQSVVFNVINNYLNVILAGENIRIRQEDVEAQTRQLERIEEFVRVGMRAVSDLYQQQATQASSEAQLLDAQSQFEVSKTRLIQTLQLDPLGEYEFVVPDPDDIPLGIQEYQALDLMRSAFENRPDLRSQEVNIDAAADGIRIAKSGFLPRINLSGSFSSRTSCSESLFGCSFSDQLDINQSKSLSLSMSIPLFNRWNTKTSVERSRVQYDNAILDLENLQQSVALEVRQAYLDYQIAIKRLDVTEKQFTAAEQALLVEQERYEIGASTLVELTQSRAAFVNGSSQRVQAIFRFQFQQKLIEYYQGVLDPAQPLFN